MWFIFGFITLISFSIYFGYKRLHAAWKGKPGTVDNTPYQHKVLRSKYGITGLLLGIDGPSGYDYTLKKETSIDRFFKSVGLSIEHQIGNARFDDLIYVVSDNTQLHHQISFNKKITETVIKLFDTCTKFNCQIEEIRNNSGRLWVKYKTKKGFSESTIANLAAEAVPLLSTIAKELKDIPRHASSRWKDPFVLKAAIILAVSTGLAINGLSHLVRLVWTDTPFTVDSNQLLIDSVYWGAGIVLTLIVASLVFLGRSARTHLVLIELILMGSFGAISTVFAELRDINMELDESLASVYEVRTLDKRISRSRKSTNYYLYLKDWNDESYRQKVSVSSRFYQSVSVGDNIVIKQKTGYLNYRWVESLEKKI